MTKQSNRWVCTLLVAAALGAGLSACVPLVVGGAAVGAMVAVDRRTSGAQLDDEGIELRAGNQIFGMYGDRAHVNVTSWNRQVLLTGEVPTQEDGQKVAQMVRGLQNVQSVVNALVVAPPSSLSQRSNDTLLTGKVKASFVDAKDVMSSAFKVVTERGVVYLMGRVTQREAQRASDIARGVSGVTKVVRVFELISEQELANTQPKPAPAPAHDAVPASAPAPAPVQGQVQVQPLPPVQ
ncbi:BON domain-containing protein [Acidovorax sp. HDW3]|uniref:BON domain-containing protein n=1 Tax=Acidovorax sp. HDW3 TaxID=2714923 RepID=UPI00140CBBFD|nr:BON domain-containing protein [Acidovorax sp. HDW3]QIL42922.1 BON domain-containing protein [Acidovorax sp. HDW3]